jgi:hypothetical protein
LVRNRKLFTRPRNEILDAWRDREAHRGLTKEQLFGEGAVMEPADALEARNRALEGARTAI